MNKVILVSIIAIVAIACAGKRKQLVKYKTIEFDERIPLLDNDPDSVNFHVNLQFVELTDYPDKKALKQVNKQLNKEFFEIKKQNFPEDPISNFKSLLIDITRNYRNECVELKKQYPEMGNSLNYELIKSSNVIYNNNDIIVFEFDTYIYSGGAHGMASKSYVHFDMKTGGLFNINDIIAKNTEAEVNKLIKERCKQLKKNPEFALYNGITPKVGPNFYFDNNNFYFVYNPYEVAPYAAGFIEIDIPLKKLRKYIDKNGPMGFLL